VTSQGRQYPDGPLEAPPGVEFAPLDTERTHGKHGFWADGAGSFLHGLLHPDHPAGPPYVHTLVPPEPIGWDEDGEPVYPEPGPAVTVTGPKSPSGNPAS
jgi:hypothetical protein